MFDANTSLTFSLVQLVFYVYADFLILLTIFQLRPGTVLSFFLLPCFFSVLQNFCRFLSDRDDTMLACLHKEHVLSEKSQKTSCTAPFGESDKNAR